MPRYFNIQSKANAYYMKEIIFYLDRDSIPPESAGIPKSILMACEALLDSKRIFKTSWDLTSGNFSESAEGDLIIRDPFVLDGSGMSWIRIKDLWPESEVMKFYTPPTEVE